MGEVAQLVTQEAVDRAWEAYRAHSERARNNMTLCLDREYVQENVCLHNRFQRLFNMMEGQ